MIGKVVIAHAWFGSAFERGGWEDSAVSAHWGFLVGDFCMGAWIYSVWLLVKRLLISTVLNLVDGALNALLSVAIQFVDTGLLLYMQPYIDRRTAFTETFGAITNLLVMLCIYVHAKRQDDPDEDNIIHTHTHTNMRNAFSLICTVVVLSMHEFSHKILILLILHFFRVSWLYLSL